jgi:hypothetical protein
MKSSLFAKRLPPADLHEEKKRILINVDGVLKVAFAGKKQASMFE